MIEKTWIDYVSAFGSIATPILVIVISTMGLKFKSSLERKIDIENKLRTDRIEIYNQILEPVIIILMSDAAWAKDKKIKI